MLLSLFAMLSAAAPYGGLPLQFEPNVGQANSQVRYIARHGTLAVFLTGDSVATSTGLEIRFAGAHSTPRTRALDRLPGQTNYFIGKDPRRWHTDVPNYARVRYDNVWPGIDIVFYGTPQQLEYDFVLHPGARPEAIELVFNTPLRLDRDGNLIARGFRQPKPRIYQDAGEVSGGYVLRSEHQVGFAVGAHDAKRRLVIDPILSYSTFLGGKLADYANGIAVDASGSVYVAGSTDGGFPVLQNGQAAPNDPCTPYLGGPCSGTFVAKLNPSGTALAYSTYLGGGSDVHAVALAVDAAGNAYVAVNVYSWAIIAKLAPAGNALVYSMTLNLTSVTSLAVDGNGQLYLAGEYPRAGHEQVIGFVAKLSADGKQFLYWSSRCFYGCAAPSAVAIDSSGNAYAAGSDSAYNIEAKPKGSSDAFVWKLDASGNSVYTALIGGSGGDGASAIAVDSAGNVYLAGQTTSADFPVTSGSFQRTLAGGSDVFVMKLAPTLKDVVWATLLGGSGDETAAGIAVDASGKVVVAGQTKSPDFPIAVATLQDQHGGGVDGFIAKLDAAGSALAWSSYLGGCGDDYLNALALDAAGNVYVTGSTKSANFPVTAGAVQPAYGGNGDAFVAKISEGSGPRLLAPCVVNAASYVPGPVAPGELVAIFHPGAGPAAGAPAVVNSAGFVGTQLADMRVLFDGVPAPLLYVRKDQVNAVAPFALEGKTAARVDVEYQGSVQASASVEVAEASPAVFSVDASGKGQAAIINEDGSVNSPAHPAPRGSWVAIWATGAGQTDPPSLDGQIALRAGNPPVHPITALIGMASAEVIYVGAAPTLVAGTVQVNVRVPADSPTGDAVGLLLTSSLGPSAHWIDWPPLVTLAVK